MSDSITMDQRYGEEKARFKKVAGMGQACVAKAMKVRMGISNMSRQGRKP